MHAVYELLQRYMFVQVHVEPQFAHKGTKYETIDKYDQ